MSEVQTTAATPAEIIMGDVPEQFVIALKRAAATPAEIIMVQVAENRAALLAAIREKAVAIVAMARNPGSKAQKKALIKASFLIPQLQTEESDLALALAIAEADETDEK